MTAPDEDEAAHLRRRAHAFELADRARAELAASSPESVRAQDAAKSEQQDAARYALARRFLEGGGTVGWLEWNALPSVQQAALTTAGRVLRQEHVQAIVAAMRPAPPMGDPLEAGTRAAFAEVRGGGI